MARNSIPRHSKARSSRSQKREPLYRRVLLDHIRTQLEMAATTAEHAADDLEALAADDTPDIAHVVRTAVVGVLRKQVDKLDALLAQGGGR